VLIVVTLLIGAGLGLTLGLTKIGRSFGQQHIIRTWSRRWGSHDVAISLVFAVGGALAGLAGGLAAPVRSLTPGMGFSILIESFIVTVIGGWDRSAEP